MIHVTYDCTTTAGLDTSQYLTLSQMFCIDAQTEGGARLNSQNVKYWLVTSSGSCACLYLAAQDSFADICLSCVVSLYCGNGASVGLLSLPRLTTCRTPYGSTMAMNSMGAG